MRLPLIAPADLTAEQKPLYADMRRGIAANFNAFKVEREDGALMGPWNPWLHEPQAAYSILCPSLLFTLLDLKGSRSNQHGTDFGLAQWAKEHRLVHTQLQLNSQTHETQTTMPCSG